MNISLTPELRAWVDERVKSGLYRDGSEVVAEALRLLHSRNRLGADPVAVWKDLGTTDMDIMALVFVVMMQASKSAAEDLKAIMEQTKAMIAAKRKLRELIGKVHKDVVVNYCRSAGETLDFSEGMGTEGAYHECAMPVADSDASGGVRVVTVDLAGTRIETAEHLRAIHEDLKGKLDSMSELSEMESLRLQMIMDRRSQLMSTLSNVMKHLSTTQNCLIHNLK